MFRHTAAKKKAAGQRKALGNDTVTAYPGGASRNFLKASRYGSAFGHDFTGKGAIEKVWERPQSPPAMQLCGLSPQIKPVKNGLVIYFRSPKRAL